VECFSGEPGTQAPGSLTTHFNGGNGFAGNTFDITPTIDMEITGLDFHARGTNVYDIDVYYKIDTCVGYEQTASAWTLLGSATGITGNGGGVGSFADLSGNGVVFSAGQKYGIYMDNSNYASAGGISYTNGATTPETYSNADLTLEAYSGTRSPAFTGGAPFTPRIWNGTLYYDGGAGSISLSSTGSAGGAMTFDVSGATPFGVVAVCYAFGTGSHRVFNPITGNTVITGLSSTRFTIAAIGAADASGNYTLARSVPSGAAGRVHVQAVDANTDGCSNVLSL